MLPYGRPQALKSDKLLEAFPEKTFWGADYTFDEAAVQRLLGEYVGGLDASTAQVGAWRCGAFESPWH